MTNNIAVCIASIPPRRDELARAICSVSAQTLKADGIFVAIDKHREGAPKTRQRALDAIDPKIYPWVAFLDDDDEFMPHHLDHLLAFALDHDVDYAYSWFKIVTANGTVLDHDSVFPTTHFTEPWNPDKPRQTTVTTLVKTELAREVGFIHREDDELIDGQRSGEDWHFTLECNRLGTIGHLVEHTWFWHHGGNTSGIPSRW